MLSSFLLVSLAAIIPAVSTAPSLTVKTWTSNVEVDGLKSLEITASPSFGDVVDYGPTHAAGLGDSSVFTVPAPGDSANVTQDTLITTYDLTRSDTGDYSVQPPNPFTYTNSDGSPKDPHPTAEGIAAVGRSSDPVVHGKRANFYGCSPGDRATIDWIAELAQDSAQESYDYLRSLSSSARSDKTRYERWFGRYNVAHKGVVQTAFKNITENINFSELYYDCSCNLPRVVARVDRWEPRLIVICPKFWEIKSSWKALALVHEASHFEINGGTYDVVEGTDAAMRLATNNPAGSLISAENYGFFSQRNQLSVLSGPY